MSSYRIILQGELGHTQDTLQVFIPKDSDVIRSSAGSGTVGEWGLKGNRDEASDEGVGQFQRQMAGKATQPRE